MTDSPDLDEQGRREPPLNGGELETLIGYIDFFRDTVRWKSSVLTDEQLHAQPLSSKLSIAGLLKHLAYVEDYWFSVVLLGNQPAEPWASVDWKANPDWEFDSSLADSGDNLREFWQDAVTASDANLETALAQGMTLDSTLHWKHTNQTISLRWLLTHLIEEYGRHCGHLDILREEIDGFTGE